MSPSERLNSVPISMELTYNYCGGEHFSFFFDRLKERRLFGVACPSCKSVYVPPRPFCGSCCVRTSGWVEVGPNGTIEACSEIFLPILDPSTGLQRKVPHTMVLVRLDGTHSCLHHVLHGEETPQIGDRVELLFAETCVGHMKDVLGFRRKESSPDLRREISKESFPSAEPMVVTGQVKIPFSFTMGDVGREFFSQLKNQKLKALQCKRCNEVHLPPTRYCKSCMSQDQSWIDVKPYGLLKGLVYISDKEREGLPREAMGWALVEMEGLKSSFLHYILDRGLKIGDHVKLQFQEHRVGSILDIKGFCR